MFKVQRTSMVEIFLRKVPSDMFDKFLIASMMSTIKTTLLLAFKAFSLINNSVFTEYFENVFACYTSQNDKSYTLKKCISDPLKHLW